MIQALTPYPIKVIFCEVSGKEGISKVREYFDFILKSYWEEYDKPQELLRCLVAVIVSAMIVFFFGFPKELFESLAILGAALFDFILLSIFYIWLKY